MKNVLFSFLLLVYLYPHTSLAVRIGRSPVLHSTSSIINDFQGSIRAFGIMVRVDLVNLDESNRSGRIDVELLNAKLSGNFRVDNVTTTGVWSRTDDRQMSFLDYAYSPGVHSLQLELEPGGVGEIRFLFNCDVRKSGPVCEARATDLSRPESLYFAGRSASVRDALIWLDTRFKGSVKIKVHSDKGAVLATAYLESGVHPVAAAGQLRESRFFAVNGGRPF